MIFFSPKCFNISFHSFSFSGNRPPLASWLQKMQARGGPQLPSPAFPRPFFPSLPAHSPLCSCRGRPSRSSCLSAAFSPPPVSCPPLAQRAHGHSWSGPTSDSRSWATVRRRRTPRPVVHSLTNAALHHKIPSFLENTSVLLSLFLETP